MVALFTPKSNSISFSADGQKIAFSEANNSSKVQVYEVRSQKKIATVKTHQNWIQSISFSPDGEKLVTGGHDGTVKLWNIKTQEELEEFRHASNITWVRLF